MPPELSDDPTDWPTDPFALLGVEPGAAETDIKRAYTRLIRRFKPEHAPEQFRRIREAYEACLQGFRWLAPPPNFQWNSPPPPPPPPPRPTAPEPTPHADREPPRDEDTSGVPDQPVYWSERFAEPPATQPRSSEIDRLWNLAVDGDEAAAYAGLVELADRGDVHLRLYWLLGLNPALDATRTRHDWLCQALKASGLSGPAAELYRRELDADPNTALYGPYADLLDTHAAAWDRLTVARWRVAAAGQSESWFPAGEDLRKLSYTLPSENEPAWLDLIVTAHGWAVWQKPANVYEFCRAELNKLRHLELRHANHFDRVDEGEYLASVWWHHVETFGSHGLLRLLPHAWVGVLHPAVLGRVVGEVAAGPFNALNQLDRSPQELRGAFAYILIRALDEYRAAHPPAGPEPDADLIRGLAAGFPGGWRREYPGLRSELLTFLLAEAIDPLVFAEACRLHPQAAVREAVGVLRQDLTLRAVWLACRLGD